MKKLTIYINISLFKKDIYTFDHYIFIGGHFFMEKEYLENKEYSEKIQILKSVFYEYQKAKNQLEELPYTYHSPTLIREQTPAYGNYEHQLLHSLAKMNYYQEYIDFIDYKLLYLNETELMIIEHDFIKPSHKKWWEMYFSSATYYRHKKKAVEKLMRLLFT